jgi:hypothetical protein
MSEWIGEDDAGVYVLAGGKKLRPPKQTDPLSLGLGKR